MQPPSECRPSACRRRSDELRTAGAAAAPCRRGCCGSSAAPIGSALPASTMRTSAGSGPRYTGALPPAGGVLPSGAGSKRRCDAARGCGAGAVVAEAGDFQRRRPEGLAELQAGEHRHDSGGGHQDRLAAGLQQVADAQRLDRAADVGLALVHVGFRGGGLGGAARRGDEVGLAGIGFARPHGLAALVAHALHDRVEVGSARTRLQRPVGELRDRAACRGRHWGAGVHCRFGSLVEPASSGSFWLHPSC